MGGVIGPKFVQEIKNIPLEKHLFKNMLKASGETLIHHLFIQLSIHLLTHCRPLLLEYTFR